MNNLSINILDQELQELWDTTTTLLTDGWLEAQTLHTQLRILYTVIFTPGTIGDKINQFKNYDIDNKKQQLIDNVYKNLSTEARTNLLVIEGFILMLFAYIAGKKLTDNELIPPFVLEEIKQEISSYTFISHLPIYEKEADSLYEHLNNIHNLLREIYYLHEFRIAESWKQYPVGQYRILEMHQAQILNSKQAFKVGLNTPEDQSICFYGQSWILELMNQNFKIGLKVAENPDAQYAGDYPIDVYYELNRQIDYITMPQEQRDKIKTSFLNSIHQIQNIMDTCLIDTLPTIKKFDY